MWSINETRLKVWRQQSEEFFEQAIVDADGTLAKTSGECKQGMDVTYKGDWGYHPLVISLANTQEPLFLENRSGSRPSHEGQQRGWSKPSTCARERGSGECCCAGTRISVRRDIWMDGLRKESSSSSESMSCRIW